MKQRRTSAGIAWYLGTIQYCTALFIGGAIWFLVARVTGFFGEDPFIKIMACVLLGALIMAESWWAHMPGFGNEVREYIGDILTSAAIAGFGMAVVELIFFSVRA